MHSPLSPFTRSILANGLTVLFKHVPTAPIVAVYLWVRVGSGLEPPETNGISHFFEHMFFKGTKRRGVGEMDRAVKELGGYNNAFTGLEYTAYYVVVPRDGFAVALDLLIDAVRNSIFDPPEIERERAVILEEINRQEDTPSQKLHTVFLENIFHGIPYERPILGTAESLARIGREDLQRFLQDYYAPDNVTVAVVGDVTEDCALGEIGRATEGWMPSGSPRRPCLVFDPDSPARRQDTSSRIIKRDVRQVYWAAGFPNTGRAASVADNYALDTASTILGSGRSSRLRRRLVEREGIATSVGAWAWPLSGAGVFCIEAEFPPSNSERILEEVIEEVQSLRDERVDEDELRKAKTILKADYAFSNETNSDLGSTLGRYETLGMLEEAMLYGRRIDSVTPEGLREAMSRLCPLNNMTVCALQPR